MSTGKSRQQSIVSKPVMLTTEISHEDIKTATWLLETLRRYDLDPARAIKFASTQMPAQRKLLAEAVASFVATLKPKSEHRRHVECALRSFCEFVEPRPRVVYVEDVKADDVRAWLSDYEADFLVRRGRALANKWYNDLLHYLTSLALYCVENDWCAKKFTSGIRPRAVDHNKVPATLAPARVAEIFGWLEEHAPDFIAYFAFCIFAGLRCDVRDGEAHRLDADLRDHARLGRHPLDSVGCWVRSKTGRPRHVKWNDCGPLRVWLMSYPADGGIVPHGLSYSQAERRLEEIRATLGIGYNEMRHTSATAMLNAPGASYANVARTLGNSESMLRRHYEGLWEPQMTVALYAIVPRRVVALTRTA